jgi:hypothetical protein
LDSDNNGITDDQEDFDHDGLSCIEEIQLGTDNYNQDTDCDGLNDRDEVKKYFTNPIKPHTDGDKIIDEEEIILGLNPLDSRTFDIPDNEYCFDQVIDESNKILGIFNDEGNTFSVSIEAVTAGSLERNLIVNESDFANAIYSNAVVGMIPKGHNRLF